VPTRLSGGHLGPPRQPGVRRTQHPAPAAARRTSHPAAARRTTYTAARRCMACGCVMAACRYRYALGAGLIDPLAALTQCWNAPPTTPSPPSPPPDPPLPPAPPSQDLILRVETDDWWDGIA
jgi:hypothetical protein